MTEATKRPWYATGIHVQSAATNEDNYVCTAEGDTPEAAIENANLIVKAGNSHDALVAALNDALHIVHVSSDATDLHDALKDWANSVECDVLPALEAAK